MKNERASFIRCFRPGWFTLRDTIKSPCNWPIKYKCNRLSQRSCEERSRQGVDTGSQWSSIRSSIVGLGHLGCLIKINLFCLIHSGVYFFIPTCKRKSKYHVHITLIWDILTPAQHNNQPVPLWNTRLDRTVISYNVLGLVSGHRSLTGITTQRSRPSAIVSTRVSPSSCWKLLLSTHVTCRQSLQGDRG